MFLMIILSLIGLALGVGNKWRIFLVLLFLLIVPVVGFAIYEFAFAPPEQRRGMGLGLLMGFAGVTLVLSVVAFGLGAVLGMIYRYFEG